ncbi:MAG: hypothetical protein AABZ60_13155, partial [Planctomycetota bacterium]
MSKKQKQKQKQQSQSQNSTQNKPQISTQNKIPQLVGDVENIANKTKFPLNSDVSNVFNILKSGNSLDSKELESIINDIKKLFEKVKEFHEQSENNSSEALRTRTTAEELQKKLEKDEIVFNDKQKSLESKDRSFIELETNLLKRETDAKVGFINKQRESLDQIKKEFEKMNTELTKTVETISIEKATWEEEKRVTLKNYSDELDKKRILLNEHESSIDSRKQDIDIREMTIKKKFETFDATLKEFEGRKIKEFQSQISDKDSRIEKLQEEIKKLREQIDAFEDIRSQLDDRSPEEAVKLIEILRKERDELRLKMERIGGEEIQERYDACQKELENKESELFDAQRELNETKTSLAKYQLGEFEKEMVKKHNEALQTHNALLNEAVRQVKQELEDLQQKNENRPIFAELKNLDEKFAQPEKLGCNTWKKHPF